MFLNMPGYEGLELSTQLVIREALLRGHDVEVLDAASSFIRVKGLGRVEYIRQATRTSADTYVSTLIMENKKVTKAVLREAGIRAPSGKDYASMEALRADYPEWRNAEVVIKPNTTNFGVAVSMLHAPFGEEAYLHAAQNAFAEDATVLVEELIPGREFRFLVIGGVVRAVLHRMPANVTGDGKSTIAALIEEKNSSPLRGTGYVSPLEKIRMGFEEEEFLRIQGLSFASIPSVGFTVFLRKNSNISTGGDSIDFTDLMHPGYSEIAAAAGAAVGASICGVDMIVKDPDAEPVQDQRRPKAGSAMEVTSANSRHGQAPSADSYAIIELNFNPALHIHDFPYKGRNREVEKHVLDLLEL